MGCPLRLPTCTPATVSLAVRMQAGRQRERPPSALTGAAADTVHSLQARPSESELTLTVRCCGSWGIQFFCRGMGLRASFRMRSQADSPIEPGLSLPVLLQGLKVRACHERLMRPPLPRSLQHQLRSRQRRMPVRRRPCSYPSPKEADSIRRRAARPQRGTARAVLRLRSTWAGERTGAASGCCHHSCGSMQF